MGILPLNLDKTGNFLCYFMNKMHHEMMFGNVEECKKDFAKFYESVFKARHLEFLQWFNPGSKLFFFLRQ